MKDQEEIGGEFHRLFLSLEGDWALERIYSDGSLFSGIATFQTISSREYSVVEEGQLMLQSDQQKYIANRNWRWQLLNENQLLIAYPVEQDGSEYHKLQFEDSNGVWLSKGEHLCGKDTYFGEYEFSKVRLIVKHQIVGPKKDYGFKSVFSKPN